MNAESPFRAAEASFDPRWAIPAGELILSRLPPHIEAVGGREGGEDMAALSAALRAAEEGRDLRAFAVRESPKGRGEGGRVAGAASAGDVAALVAHVAEEGDVPGLGDAVRAARTEGLVPVRIVALVAKPPAYPFVGCLKRGGKGDGMTESPGGGA